MRISKLEVQNLHNAYDYALSFNWDLTLIYGLNGSGKTTILNILSIMMNGQFYKFFQYDFKKIVLTYLSEQGGQDNKFIIAKNEDKLYISIDKEEFVVEYDEFRKIRDIDESELDYYIIRKYPQVKKIHKLFNNFYLPLSRINTFDSSYYDFEEPTKYDQYMLKRSYKRNKNTSDMMLYVEDLLRSHYIR